MNESLIWEFNVGRPWYIIQWYYIYDSLITAVTNISKYGSKIQLETEANRVETSLDKYVIVVFLLEACHIHLWGKSTLI